MHLPAFILTQRLKSIYFFESFRKDSDLSLEPKRHLVIAGNSDVHVAKWRVSVAQSNGRDVDIGGLSERLVVGPGIRHDQEAGLPEGSLDLIGEGTGGEAAVERCCTGSRSKLQHSSL